MPARARVAAGIAVVAIASVAVAWLQVGPVVSAGDAVTAARRALEDAGVDAAVEPDPVRSTYRSESHDPVDVWAVRATVRSEPIELRLAVADAAPVAIDDRTVDRTSYVLSEHEYEAVARSVADPARPRALRRNISFTIAAVLVVALTIVHAALAARPEETHR